MTISIIARRAEVASLVRGIKEDKVRSCHDPDRRMLDIRYLVHGWRGAELVVTVFPSGQSFTVALAAAQVAAVGFGCDAVAVTTETFSAGVAVSPLTGKPWVPGEMQRVAEEHGGLDTGAVVEALVTLVVNRAGDVAGLSAPYRIERSVNALGVVSYSVEWLPESMDDGHGDYWDGGLVKMLARFMNEPPVDALFARTGLSVGDFGLTPDQVRTHMDCAVVKRLLDSGFEGAVVLLANGDDPERGEIIERSLGDRAQKMP